MAKQLANFLSANSRSIFVVIMLVLIVQAIMASGITKNTSPYFISLDHEVRQDEVTSKTIFTRSGETVLVLLKFQTTSVFNNKVVQLTRAINDEVKRINILDLLDRKSLSAMSALSVKELSASLSNYDTTLELYTRLQRSVDAGVLNEVMGEYLFPVKSVKSLINTDNIYEQDDEIRVESSYFEQVENNWSPQTIALILDNPLLTGAFVSPKGDSLTLHVELNVNEEHTAENKLVIHKIQEIVTRHLSLAGSELAASVHYAGVPVVNGAMSDVVERDNALYFPFVILMVLILLMVSFRSLLAAVYGLVIAIASIIITMGFMPVLGISLNIITTILPIFIITIAVTDAIHVLSDVGAPTNLNSKDNVHRSLSKLFRPMLITSLTTAVGFFSLAITEITNIQSFGIMVGGSVIIAFGLSVTLLPLLLIRWPIKTVSEQKQSSAFSTHASRLLTKSSVCAWCVVLATCLVAFIGINMVRVDQASIEAFDADTQVRMDNKVMNEQGVGSVPVAIWLRTKDAEGILNPNVLKVIARADVFLSTYGEVVDSVSLLNFIQQMQHTLNGELRGTNDEQKYTKLDLKNTTLTRQYLFLLEGSAERDLEAVVNVGPYTETRIIVSMQDDSSAKIDAMLKALDEVILPILPENVELIYSSYGAITVAAADEVVKSQIISMSLSLLLILLIVSLVFGSLSTGLISLIPLCMTLACMFGIMGVFGFSIDIASSVIASIAFGIGIDYSIHFIEAIRRTYQPNNPVLGIENTLKQVFSPIFVSAVVISSGFSLLLLSSFKPIANLGLLITVAMLMSATFSLVILPRLLLFKSAVLYHVVAGVKKNVVQGADPVLLDTSN